MPNETNTAVTTENNPLNNSQQNQPIAIPTVETRSGNPLSSTQNTQPQSIPLVLTKSDK